jgi:hypothetical protein
VADEVWADALPDDVGVERCRHRFGVAAARGVEPAQEKLDVVALHDDLPSRCFRQCETPAGRRSRTATQPLGGGRRTKLLAVQLADAGERGGRG